MHFNFSAAGFIRARYKLQGTARDDVSLIYRESILVFIHSFCISFDERRWTYDSILKLDDFQVDAILFFY